MCGFLHCCLPLLISREQCIVRQTIHQQFATIDLDEYSLLLLLYACVYTHMKFNFRRGNETMMEILLPQMMLSYSLALCELNFFYLFLSRALIDIQFCDFKRLRAKKNSGPCKSIECEIHDRLD